MSKCALHAQEDQAARIAVAVTKLQRKYTQAAEAMHRQRAELEAQLESAGAELVEVTPPHAWLTKPCLFRPLIKARPPTKRLVLAKAAASMHGWVLLMRSIL